MAKEKSEIKKKITVQIQGGFSPPLAPIIRGGIMANDKKNRIDEGFVPPKQPTKPAGIEKKGFVPPSSPRKPPDKPGKDKK